MSVISENQVKQKAWISRFYGYLGALDYLRNAKMVEFGQSWVDPSERTPEYIEEDPMANVPADNIVYVYGIPQGGKSRYRNELFDVLAEEGTYTCINFDFDGVMDVNSLQKQLRTRFTAATKGWKFAFQDLVEGYNSHDFDTMNGLFNNYVKDASDVLGGLYKLDFVQAATGVSGMVSNVRGTIKAFSGERLTVSDIYKREVEFLKKEKKRNPSGSFCDKKDYFKYLRMDICYNTESQKNKRYVCFVDDFHRCSECLKEPGAKKQFLQMMSQLPQIIWVLFGSENPDKEEREIVSRDNRWRMGGIDRKYAVDFLRERCPNAGEAWYSGVYRHTGGYMGLMELCVKAQRKAESRFVEPHMRDDLFDADGNELPDASVRHREAVRRAVDKWIARVWNDGPWNNDYRDDDERRNPIAFLMDEAFRDAEDGGCDVRQLLIPCLCYMAKLSAEHLRTIHQYSWERGAKKVDGLNITGKQCLQEIEAYTPFCIEYVEYPGVLYLDPIIVEILMRHEKFNKWLKQFTDYCVEEAAPSVNYEQDAREEKEKHTQDIQIPQPSVQRNLGGLESKFTAEQVGQLLQALLSQTTMPVQQVKDEKKPEVVAPVAQPLTEQEKKEADSNRGIMPNHVSNESGDKEAILDDVVDITEAEAAVDDKEDTVKDENTIGPKEK